MLDQAADDAFGLEFFGEPLITGGAPGGLARGQLGGGGQLPRFFLSQAGIALVQPMQHGLSLRVKLAALFVQPGLLLGEFATVLFEGGVELLVIQHQRLPGLFNPQAGLFLTAQGLGDVDPGFLHRQPQLEGGAVDVFEFGAQTFQPLLFVRQVFLLSPQQFLPAAEFGLLLLAFLLPLGAGLTQQLPISIDRCRPGRATLEDGFLLAFDGPQQFIEGLAVGVQLLFAALELLRVFGELLPLALTLPAKFGLGAFQIVTHLVQMFLLEPQAVFFEHALPLPVPLLVGEKLGLLGGTGGPFGFGGGLPLGELLLVFRLPLRAELFPGEPLLLELLVQFIELLLPGRAGTLPGGAFGGEFQTALLPFGGELFPQSLPFVLKLLFEALAALLFAVGEALLRAFKLFPFGFELGFQAEECDPFGGEFLEHCRTQLSPVPFELLATVFHGLPFVGESLALFGELALGVAQTFLGLVQFLPLRGLLLAKREAFLIEPCLEFAEGFLAVFEFGELFDGLLDQQPGASRSRRGGVSGRRLLSMGGIEADCAPSGQVNGHSGRVFCAGRGGRRRGRDHRLGHDGHPFPEAENRASSTASCREGLLTVRER